MLNEDAVQEMKNKILAVQDEIAPMILAGYRFCSLKFNSSRLNCFTQFAKVMKLSEKFVRKTKASCKVQFRLYQ